MSSNAEAPAAPADPEHPVAPKGDGDAPPQRLEAPKYAIPSGATLTLDDDITISPLSMEHHAEVVKVWQEGFAEMGPLFYDDFSSNPTNIFLALGIICGAAYMKWWFTAATVASFTALLWTPPLGRGILQALLWQGIKSQTRRDMTEATILAKWRRPGTSEFFVALHNGRVAGCVAVTNEHTLGKEARAGVPALRGEASVWRLSVDPEYRKLGLGKRLMHTAETWARDHGCHHISLVTGNPASKKFYQRLGYGSETEPRAVAAVFGSPDAVGWGLGWLKYYMLRRRLSRVGSILMKEL